MERHKFQIFKEVNRSKPFEVKSTPILRGAENEGIIFHCAVYEQAPDDFVLDIIEKRTLRKKEIELAHTLKKMCAGSLLFEVLPRVYKVRDRRKYTSVFMEYIKGVDDARLREENVATLLISSLFRLNKLRLESLDMPRKWWLVLGELFFILRVSFNIMLSSKERWILFKFVMFSPFAAARLPVVLSHGDLSLQNMAYDNERRAVRFIDFGSLRYNLAGSDFKNLFRGRQVLNYDFKVLINEYARMSGLRTGDLMFSVWLADLQRCALRISRAQKRNRYSILEAELLAFRSILKEFEAK